MNERRARGAAGVAPRLIAITDVAGFGEPATRRRWEELSSAARPGSLALQLRDKQLGVRQRLELARGLGDVARRSGQYFVVNDRLDLALLCQADGVHVGETSFTVDEVRWLFLARGRGDIWLSAAAHDPNAVRAGADALLLSPVVRSRKGQPALGLRVLSRVAKRVKPQAVYALGGVDEACAGHCLEAGAAGVAAVGAVWGPRWRQLLDVLDIKR